MSVIRLIQPGRPSLRLTTTTAHAASNYGIPVLLRPSGGILDGAAWLALRAQGAHIETDDADLVLAALGLPPIPANRQSIGPLVERRGGHGGGGRPSLPGRHSINNFSVGASIWDCLQRDLPKHGSLAATIRAALAEYYGVPDEIGKK